MELFYSYKPGHEFGKLTHINSSLLFIFFYYFFCYSKLNWLGIKLWIIFDLSSIKIFISHDLNHVFGSLTKTSSIQLNISLYKYFLKILFNILKKCCLICIEWLCSWFYLLENTLAIFLYLLCFKKFHTTRL